MKFEVKISEMDFPQIYVTLDIEAPNIEGVLEAFARELKGTIHGNKVVGSQQGKVHLQE